MKFNKIIATLNIFATIAFTSFSIPYTAASNFHIKCIYIFSFVTNLTVSFALFYEKDKSYFVDNYFKLKDELEKKIENYEHARTRLVEYVLESFNGLYTFIDVEEAFVAGYHCKPNGKDLGVYAEEYVNNIKNEKESN